jgi:hypothetical protein
MFVKKQGERVSFHPVRPFHPPLVFPSCKKLSPAGSKTKFISNICRAKAAQKEK